MGHGCLILAVLLLSSASLGAAIRDTPASRLALPSGPYLPIVLWHGMGDSCCNPQGIGAVQDRIQRALPGVFVHSVATGATESADVLSTYFGDANAQVRAACEALRALPQLAGGYVAVGFSQGGLLLRGLLERCTGEGAPAMHTLITMGSPHQGVMDAMQALLGHGVYYSWLQHNLLQAQYFKDPYHLDWYRETSGFLADINNDRDARNSSYVAALTSLRSLVLYQFDNDLTVVPRESSQFGFYNGTHTESMEESAAYRDDRLGLRTLNESGRLTLANCPGFHMQFTLDWFEQHVLPHVAVPVADARVAATHPSRTA
ncbi:Palmitoyl-protein thioesterase 1 [Auxenochlorella protothecoides]|uniref:Palmitoyl-protein thioesterase 1 n=1 Tax=Auxenochlorella protothecoides TaxID=3075 RepID=A0A087SHQ4_AUXPR|nr:Palmitoyl-protein thioesterase 1 [Auxenochlorella protothecoides]KFM25258.1 Palmitoyl-protein thioesterase 1 [Auxenochlorella protothecoides]